MELNLLRKLDLAHASGLDIELLHEANGVRGLSPSKLGEFHLPFNLLALAGVGWNQMSVGEQQGANYDVDNPRFLFM